MEKYKKQVCRNFNSVIIMKRGQVYHYSFICLSAGTIDWQPCCFASILLLCAPPKVVSVLVLFVVFRGSFQFIIIQVGLHRLLLLLQWPFLQPLFLCSLCCNMLSANDSEVVDWGQEHTLLWLLIFFQISLDHRGCGQGPPVLKLGIISHNYKAIAMGFSIFGK